MRICFCSLLPVLRVFSKRNFSFGGILKSDVLIKLSIYVNYSTQCYDAATDADTFDFLLTVELNEAVGFSSKLVPRLVRPPSPKRAILAIV